MHRQTFARTLSILALAGAACGAHAQLLGGGGAFGGALGGNLGGSLGGNLTGGTSVPVITNMRSIDAGRSAVGTMRQAVTQDVASAGQSSANLGLAANGSANGNASGNASGNAAGTPVTAGADGGSSAPPEREAAGPRENRR